MKKSLIRLHRNLVILQNYLEIIRDDINNTTNDNERKCLEEYYKLFEILFETLLEEKKEKENNPNNNNDNDEDEDCNGNGSIIVTLM
ncbi:unnamed protein product [Rotaria sp. Silwood1]|nr:unnamed protein product [Rotaria sp. Silwood1]